MKLLLELLTSECRWAVGDKIDDQQFFCAEPADPCESYCTEHRKRAYIPTSHLGVDLSGDEYIGPNGGLMRRDHRGQGRSVKSSLPTKERIARYGAMRETKLYDLRSDHEPDLVDIFGRAQ